MPIWTLSALLYHSWPFIERHGGGHFRFFRFKLAIALKLCVVGVNRHLISLTTSQEDRLLEQRLLQIGLYS
jgi:hypothetical protein